jgi:hypothetical protein
MCSRRMGCPPFLECVPCSIRSSELCARRSCVLVCSERYRLVGAGRPVADGSEAARCVYLSRTDQDKAKTH